ncbi:P-loop containing nucleoside triphosphate hydrolase protein [Tribonema minus]|uniref:P-loop containing nucleoside triphosphate hydrolase protein n=1 Tax=Tribonema minus TaxID=303371 RepID=A0A835Z7T2_9STRA|nr:P-loop containing nucleoside triphosphate hydrolase protein [Tribonema minus]
MAGVQQVPVHVEVALQPSCALEFSEIEQEVRRLIHGGGSTTIRDGPIDVSTSRVLSENVLTAKVTGLTDSGVDKVPFWHCDPCVHAFQLSPCGVEREVLDGDGDGEDVAAFDQWVLPAQELEGLWESLLLEDTIKAQLLDYATSALLFSDRQVSKHIISWNRVVLLHGPPGTGKTSLCKALAHKLAIRLGGRFQAAQLLEINAHSLFSKWFSESGKLVGRLFGHIAELAEDESTLVCILVDEVESLTTARSAAMSGNEPSDAVRVVNAVLTQIDSLRARDNVLVLTTSNVSKAIDLAFVDRADIKMLIGLPGVQARYSILQSCLAELMRTGIIDPPQHVPDCASELVRTALHTSCDMGVLAPARIGEGFIQLSYFGVLLFKTVGMSSATGCRVMSMGILLLQVAALAQGLSGRALRKLPFQAHAFFVHRSSTTLHHYLDALLQAVRTELQRRAQLETGSPV